ncbi:MAG: rod shape-determining protein RodA [Myxococcaceae bacterium]|nr:rod shape-determining protein RodA [Myxococcaceae bacterium]
MQLGAQRRMIVHAPWGVLIASLAVSLIGLYNLMSAARSMWTSQAIYLGVGIAVLVAVTLVDLRFIQSAAVPIYLLNIGLLLLLKLVGTRAKGAESWLVLGPFRVQPAEFMKIGMVLMMAKYFHDDDRPAAPSYGFLRLLPPLVLAIVPTLIVLVQPDLGTALMMTFTALTLIAFARVKWTVVVAAGVVGLLGAGVIWNDFARPVPEGEKRVTLIRHHMKKHQEGRITGWLEPESDLKGTNYHSMQSKIAVGSGGFAGKGWKEGTQTALRYLPEQHTDFIFSVWAEEHGFLSCLLLLLLYGVILVGSLGVAYQSRDRFGAFVAVGIAAMIFWQVFENIGMVTGLLPVTGITLPLMSYGGSSMVSVMLGLGLLANISMRRHLF